MNCAGLMNFSAVEDRSSVRGCLVTEVINEKGSRFKLP